MQRAPGKQLLCTLRRKRVGPSRLRLVTTPVATRSSKQDSRSRGQDTAAVDDGVDVRKHGARAATFGAFYQQ
jgi:hypothetical protein